MFSSIGIPEMMIMLVGALVLFGGRKIPQLARDLGMGIREFKRTLTQTKDNLPLNEHDIEEWENVREISVTRKSPKSKNQKKAKKPKGSQITKHSSARAGTSKPSKKKTRRT